MCANPVCISNNVAYTHDTAQCHYYSSKGKVEKVRAKASGLVFKERGIRREPKVWNINRGLKVKVPKASRAKPHP
jgi:hypothetical protein